jgi:hypothetical protein
MGRVGHRRYRNDLVHAHRDRRSVELFNSSLLSDLDLDLLQGDSVVLATLRFHSNTPIVSALSIDFNPATDIPASRIRGRFPSSRRSSSPIPSSGEIRWIARDTEPPLPLPGTLWLLAAPLAWLARRVVMRY